MKTIIVASTNPVKIQAALAGFRALFPGEAFEARGVSVPSGVSDQPMTDEETLSGALNRAKAAREQTPDADFWAGIEGGCEQKFGELWAYAWVVVLGADRVGKSRTAAFALPHEIAELVRQGVELGEADDRVFGRSNSKQSNGAVGILTDDVIDRAGYYEHAVVLALVPFKNPSLTF
ncbi:MAG: inosine/xanthosine triphosphatase [Anaerolineae bacterium]|nr:inosine/xanthosine triphosphatase [Anaerolineae bacterium]